MPEEQYNSTTFTHMRSMFLVSMDGEDSKLKYLLEYLYKLKWDEYLKRECLQRISMDYSPSHS